MGRYTAEDMRLLALLENVTGASVDCDGRTFTVGGAVNNKQAKKLRSILKRLLKADVEVGFNEEGSLVVKLEGPNR